MSMINDLKGIKWTCAMIDVKLVHVGCLLTRSSVCHILRQNNKYLNVLLQQHRDKNYNNTL